MRLLLAALALVLTLMYFTFGLRFGYVTLTPTYMLNATGESRYGFITYDDKQSVGVRGTCDVRKGNVTVRLLDPGGTQVAGQVCPKGKWGLAAMGKGRQGTYELVVEYKDFTGTLDLNETRE
ncbi:hypothetical protein GCM10008956_10760 [Deinococcus arenae]|uniref:Uncharacterized protein n=1 Tax=Deinococcus arenae TaxID=1452751 RepID=A0A8H9GKZ6_9DEIO|nr:hypothetical protein [Deinococcus arenae]AWT35288.1 hypothetical protein DM785_06775 [Deinococcus actinosclerus]GGM35983.1 hypothetical protein GCM10008956_10760 [Deinococcus arenae]